MQIDRIVTGFGLRIILMKDMHIVLLNEKLDFLINKGFKTSVNNDCYSLCKDEFTISFFFAYGSNEISCTVSHKRTRLTLLQLVEYFGIRPNGFYYMYGSISEIPDVIHQYAELLEKLIEKYQILDVDVFENVSLYYLIMSNVMKNTSDINSQISLANKRFKDEDYFWAGRLYLEYYCFLKKSEKAKLNICKKKCQLLV